MTGFIGNIGPWELMLILLIAVIVVGPGKLPDVARSAGKAMGEFRRATSGVKKEFEEAILLESKNEPKSAAAKNEPAPEEYIIEDVTAEPESIENKEEETDSEK